jgi:hypothetical protein
MKSHWIKSEGLAVGDAAKEEALEHKSGCGQILIGDASSMRKISAKDCVS